jgi:hypothetical protein
MKIILTELQVKKIIDEQSDGSFDRRYSTATAAEKSNADNRQMVKAIINMDPHDRNQLLSFAAAFVPVIGPALSLGIAAYDAKTYFQQGKKKEAGLSLFLALLPGMGAVVSKIPGIKQLGVKGMSTLGKKIIDGGRNLTALENEVVLAVKSHPQIYSLAKDDIKSKMASAGYDVVTGQKKV